MVIRKLEKWDFDKGYLEVLANLTVVGDVTKDNFSKRCLEIKYNEDYYVLVADIDGQVVGCLTLLIEKKFVHNCGCVGHIEDVVTKKEFEHRGIARALMTKAIEEATRRGCYKVILDCREELVPFYSRFGFKPKERQMRLDLPPL